MADKYDRQINIVINSVGYLKQLTTKNEIEISLDKQLTITQLRDEVDILKGVSANYIVNGKAVGHEYVLKDGDIVTLVPHVSGG